MSKRRAVSILLNFIKERWPIYIIGLSAVVVTDFLQVFTPRMIGWIVDFYNGKTIPPFFIGQSKLDTLWVLFVVLLVSRFGLSLTRVFWRFFLIRQEYRAVSMLKSDIWSSARYLSFKDLSTKFTKGILMNASTSDVSNAGYLFGIILVAFIDIVFMGVFTLILMFSINVSMTIWSCVILLFVPFIAKKLSDKEVALYESAQESLSDFNDLSSQTVSTIHLQRLTQTGSFWKQKLIGSAENYRQSRLDATYAGLRFIPGMHGTAIISYIILFGFGIYNYFNGIMTIGEFISMQGLIFMLQGPLAEIGFIISDWRSGVISLKRIVEVYDHKKEDYLYKNKGNIKEVDVVVSADKLSYRYHDGKEDVFKDIGLTLKKGDRLGITGPIGAGKTTLLKVLAGIDREHEGEVLFHNKKFDEYDNDKIRRYIGVVPQKTFLFADTIRKNIAMDNMNMSDEEIWHYLDIAGVGKHIRELPNQIDTELGEWGINLSGGQKQRLTLARALARKPKLLFLDDCLSAVDTVTEDLILRNIDLELKDTTVVWIAHRKSTLKYCTKFLEL